MYSKKSPSEFLSEQLSRPSAESTKSEESDSSLAIGTHCMHTEHTDIQASSVQDEKKRLIIKKLAAKGWISTTNQQKIR